MNSARTFLSFIEGLPRSVGVELDRVAVRVLDVDGPAAAPPDHLHSRGLHAPAEDGQALLPDVEPEVIETARSGVHPAADLDEVEQIAATGGLEKEHARMRKGLPQPQHLDVEALGGSQVPSLERKMAKRHGPILLPRPRPQCPETNGFRRRWRCIFGGPERGTWRSQRRPERTPPRAEGTQLIRGLEGVVAAETELCDLDGKNGRLAYRGYDIDDLARKATFEEVAYLLWMGELPNKSQLDRFMAELAAARPIPGDLVKAYALMPKQADPMRVLQASVAILGMHDPDTTDNSRAANLRKAMRLTSQFATAICAHHRVRSGQEPVPPSKDLTLAANFLYMLTGKKPSEVTTKAFDASLVLYAEHELNASTFTTRVIAATLSDMHSAVAGGVGALKGTLHGGAGEAVMNTLLEIGKLDNVDAFVDKAFAAKRRFMGMGHRVYTAGDPRAAILKGMAEASCRETGQALWYDLAVKLHTKVSATKTLIPNVDFYSAPLFYSIGIPVDLFTPVIAASRIAGWTANLLEQYDDNRLIRPRADYKGPGLRSFVPVEKR